MRLLLAEDEIELSNALVTVLKRNNYTVDAVYDGEEATDYLMTDVYDAVILDIMMPKKDGISVLKDLRRSGNRVPVMLLTAKAEIDDRVEGLDAGADDYLPKPFSMKELLARVRALCRRQTELQENVLSFSNMTLNRSNYELGTEKGSIRLANKEFQMMEMLMANPSHVISTDRFMDKIWGFDSEAELNVVWVYVSYLRKKLVSIDAKAQIKAHRGLGYSLEEVK
ncbi:MAG: response regulator transcription factor [Clostridia bacterium]|nr:response regulator transcription factor [Clostridia bacterium]